MSDPFSDARQVDIAGLSVFVGMPTHRDLHPEVVLSLLRAQAALQERGIPSRVQLSIGSSLVHHARSAMVDAFLRTDMNRLLWWDSDIVVEPETVLRLLARSVDLPIVAGAYPPKQDPIIFMLRVKETAVIADNGCMQVDGLGLGFCVMHREVVEAVAAQAPQRRLPMADSTIAMAFNLDGEWDTDGSPGEDMRFFRDTARLGFPCWVDPSLEVGHVGAKVYRGRLLDYMRRVE